MIEKFKLGENAPKIIWNQQKNNKDMDIEAIKKRMEISRMKDKLQSIKNQKFLKKWRQSKNKRR